MLNFWLPSRLLLPFLFSFLLIPSFLHSFLSLPLSSLPSPLHSTEKSHTFIICPPFLIPLFFVTSPYCSNISPLLAHIRIGTFASDKTVRYRCWEAIMLCSKTKKGTFSTPISFNSSPILSTSELLDKLSKDQIVGPLFSNLIDPELFDDSCLSIAHLSQMVLLQGNFENFGFVILFFESH